MRRVIRRALIAAALLLAAPAAAELPLQSPLPDAAWPDLSGETVRLSALKGRPVLINLWASWCPPCIAELPVLAGLHRAHAADGLRVVGINIDVDLGTAERFTEKHRLPYTVLHDAQGVSAKPFRVDQIPATFLFDAAGRLVWQTADEVKADDPGLRAALKRALPRGGPRVTDPKPDDRLRPLRRAPSPIPPVPAR